MSIHKKKQYFMDGGIIPFTIRTPHLCQALCGERVKGARRRSLDNPGSRQQKSPLRGTSDSDV
ncbi:MAG: hypothetical protein E7I42_09860, partial [Pluralibacter gergoviae]|nr:hypothetical protein [Pluralibacter gergoviae]